MIKNIASGRLWAPLFVLLASGAAAQDFTIELPVDCTLGETCYIQHFVDRQVGEGVRDIGCGAVTYDGHDGTDVALPTLADMRAGVDVIAAAPGTVVAFRDGMADISLNDPNAPDVTGRECGNGVVLDHGGGWRTQYCHLKQGSVIVENGQSLDAGDPLGQVGMSGSASFPHVHFTTRFRGEEVDPFAPDGAASCDPTARGIWADPPAYVASGALTFGFADAVPKYRSLQDGQQGLTAATPETSALVVWVYAFGGLEGDRIEIILDGPSGEISRFEEPLPKAQPLYMRASGKRRPLAGWPLGSYTGTVVLSRDGAELDRRVTTIQVQ